MVDVTILPVTVNSLMLSLSVRAAPVVVADNAPAHLVSWQLLLGALLAVALVVL